MLLHSSQKAADYDADSRSEYSATDLPQLDMVRFCMAHVRIQEACFREAKALASVEGTTPFVPPEERWTNISGALGKYANNMGWERPYKTRHCHVAARMQDTPQEILTRDGELARTCLGAITSLGLAGPVLGSSVASGDSSAVAHIYLLPEILLEALHNIASRPPFVITVYTSYSGSRTPSPTGSDIPTRIPARIPARIPSPIPNRILFRSSSHIQLPIFPSSLAPTSSRQSSTQSLAQRRLASSLFKFRKRRYRRSSI